MNKYWWYIFELHGFNKQQICNFNLNVQVKICRNSCISSQEV